MLLIDYFDPRRIIPQDLWDSRVENLLNISIEGVKLSIELEEQDVKNLYLIIARIIYILDITDAIMEIIKVMIEFLKFNYPSYEVEKLIHLIYPYRSQKLFAILFKPNSFKEDLTYFDCDKFLLYSITLNIYLQQFYTKEDLWRYVFPNFNYTIHQDLILTSIVHGEKIINLYWEFTRQFNVEPYYITEEDLKYLLMWSNKRILVKDPLSYYMDANFINLKYDDADIKENIYSFLRSLLRERKYLKPGFNFNNAIKNAILEPNLEILKILAEYNITYVSERDDLDKELKLLDKLKINTPQLLEIVKR
jgi:hypothetical protein